MRATICWNIHILFTSKLFPKAVLYKWTLSVVFPPLDLFKDNVTLF
jgi:hypothetical protein